MFTKKILIDLDGVLNEYEKDKFNDKGKSMPSLLIFINKIDKSLKLIQLCSFLNFKL